MADVIPLNRKPIDLSREAQKALLQVPKGVSAGTMQSNFGALIHERTAMSYQRTNERIKWEAWNVKPKDVKRFRESDAVKALQDQSDLPNSSSMLALPLRATY